MNERLSILKKRIANKVAACSTSISISDAFIGYIKYELRQYSSSKEEGFLQKLSANEYTTFDLALLDSNTLTMKEYISLENDILGLLDLFFEIDLERKEFETSKELAMLKAKLLSPFIESNSLLMVGFGFGKEKVALAKEEAHPAYDYFYNLKR